MGAHQTTRQSFRRRIALFLAGLLAPVPALVPFLLFALASASVLPARAASDFPADPILRLNPEGHFATINRIDLDAGGRWLVSGAHDKTVKIWRLADGALERTLRLPQGEGHLGKVFAVAISPDGAQLAAGGWTGGSKSGQQVVYIFDRATGALRHRIEGLPNVINHLAYAPDGERLAATLGGANGIRLYDTGDYREIARDADYGSRSYWADFAADGRLVTSSYDGKVRLYGPDSSLEQTAEAPGGERPFGVAFAPDGRRIALGYDDSTRVDILDAVTLERLDSADTTGVDNGDLGRVAWSVDGRTLLAGGRYADGGWTPIRRWTEGQNGAGLGPYDELRVTTNAVMDLRPSRTAAWRWGRRTRSPSCPRAARPSGSGPPPSPTSAASFTGRASGSRRRATGSLSATSNGANARPCSRCATLP